MAKRLIKIAKELNVGTGTIVEFLNKNGFELDNKPTAKVSDEMENALLKEFQNSVAIKEQADQLVIGTRQSNKKDIPEVKPTQDLFTPIVPKEEPPAPPVEEVEKPIVKEEEVVVVVEEEVAPVVADTPEPTPEQTIEPTAPPVEEVEVETIPEVVANDRPQLKVIGKIDLDANKKSKSKSKKQEKVKEEVPAEAPVEAVKEKVEEVPVEAVKEEVVVVEEEIEIDDTVIEVDEAIEEKVETPVSVKSDKATVVPNEGNKEEMIRADTPQLKGLKILGKIDTDKLKKKKKKKKPENQPRTDNKKAGDSSKTGNKSSDDSATKKRRKRKKVPATTLGNNSGGSNSNNNNNNNRNNSNNSNRNSNNRNTNSRNSNNRGRRKPNEVKEVSKKEIDDKIKATMARLSGGGKNKRQKLRRNNRDTKREKQEQVNLEKVTGKLQLTEFVSVSEFASLMDVSITDVITTCMNAGVIVSINQRLDAEIIELVAGEFGHEVEFISAEDQITEEEEIIDDPKDLEDRAPIVTVMGHVDHGKTSLLDYIRSANVIGGEAGGITQHIGAYEVEVGPEKKKITFLDTPGHEAFTAMRARGAKVTDVAIIIISADDDIMPQTKEAISHAQAANVPMVFAINKIDKDGSDPQRIKAALAAMNLQVEEWGGKYQSQDISAKNGTNIDKLLEKILLEAEILELKANPSRKALGTVIEASLDKGRGYVTKILVQTGSLRIGDSMVAGEHSGKIKAMFNEHGKKIKVAGPSTPVLILGLSGAPQAGEKFKVMDSEQEVRQLASSRAQINREQANRANKRVSLDEIGRRLALGTFKELNLIVKGDVDGSVEALSDSLLKLSIETIQVNVIHKAVGQIIESDVLLASASDAIVIGFQVRPSLGARKLAEREGVQIKTYSIIYEAIEEIKSAIEGMLEPTKEEKIVGQLEVRETYKISRIGTIAGCLVQEGKFSRNLHIRVIRDGIVVFPMKEGAVGEISSLKRFKDDVKDVKNGMECGVTIKNFNDIKVGDNIEGYEIIEVKQTL